MSRGIFSKIKEKTSTMSAYLPYESVYYEKIAEYYKLAKNCLLIAMAVFVAIVIIFCHRDLRPENIRYLFKYIDSNPISTSSNYNDIYYDSNEKTFFTFYKGDLALVGDGKLKLYTVAGSNILDEKLRFENAVCDSGGKYMLIYSPGEKNVSLFNSFSNVYSASYTHPVISAYSGENGSFAVVTREDRYRSAIYIYNNSFKNIYQWRSNERYACSVAVSPNGKTAAILSYSQSGGTYSRELLIQNVSKDEQILSSVTEGGIPIKTGFFENGGLYSLCSDKLEIYNKKFGKVKSENIDGTVWFCKTFGDGILLVTGKNRANADVRYYSADGEEVFFVKPALSVLDADAVEDTLYLLTDNYVILYSGDTVSRAEIPTGAKRIFVFDDGNAMVCYNDCTQLIYTNDFN